jgi:hypothetical protein
MANETPSPLGAKRCLAWINACKEMGWPQSAIPKLVDLFWEFKDRDGNLKGEGPRMETRVECPACGAKWRDDLGTGFVRCERADCPTAKTRIDEAKAVCSACGLSGSGGLASGGSTVTIRCNKPYCPGGTSANR